MEHKLISKFLLMAVMLVGSLIGRGQNRIDEVADKAICVRQIPDSEDALRNYFADYGLTDTIYAIIFRPANCPRCESAIKGYEAKLRTYEPDKSLVLISVYHDPIAASAYIKNYGFVADTYIFDTDESFEKFLSFGSGFLHVPYLLKIVPKEGSMIVGVNANEATDEFVEELRDYKTPKEQKLYAVSGTDKGYFSAPESTLEESGKIPLRIPEGITMSEIIYQPEFYKKCLVINDKLNETAMLFSFSASGDVIDFRSVVCPDSAQRRMFVSVPDDIYLPWLAERGIRFIPLTPKMFDDSTLVISYSLPKIWFTGPQSVGYMNQSAMLVVNPDSLEKSEVIPLVKDPFTEEFFYPHFTVSNLGGDFAVGCQRLTWPMEYTREEYEDDPCRNPFIDDFYRYEQPVVAVFDRYSGELKQRREQLPALARKTKTGVYFIAPVMDTFEGHTVYSDGFSGEIRLGSIDDEDSERILRAYSIPEEVLPLPDESKFYDYEMTAPYRKIFNRRIVDLRLTGKEVYVLIRYEGSGNRDGKEVYSVAVLDLENGHADERRFPPSGMAAVSYGLRRLTDGGVRPYAVGKINNDWQIVTYKCH